MPTELDPIVGNWYSHSVKGQRFEVVAYDEENGLVETQHFDGDLEEISLDDWYDSDIVMAEAPENWAGAMDIGTKDDFGTEVTDTDINDWNEPLEEIHQQEGPSSVEEEE